jgi:hypothetical protein
LKCSMYASSFAVRSCFDGNLPRRITLACTGREGLVLQSSTWSQRIAQASGSQCKLPSARLADRLLRRGTHTLIPRPAWSRRICGGQQLGMRCVSPDGLISRRVRATRDARETGVAQHAACGLQLVARNLWLVEEAATTRQAADRRRAMPTIGDLDPTCYAVPARVDRRRSSCHDHAL